ncbi:hypothetical protein UFOVP104_28 [uncultured Caudovirales phage]|uniref:Uncharacterized protein n=1 Tax=uncultured Caudovirales phage TaxID=2100421 RepID=A0A6J5L4W5_9CAUD|nr:hypothetical protein UFOVP104_28 [uncultured Caudovirales phage]CAB4134030.1 hypothetical protein UFOVP271_8 [uncultured Caudovirales phage]
MINGGISEETRKENKAIREDIYNLISKYYSKGEKGSYIVNKQLTNELGICRTSLSLWMNYKIDFKQENLNKVKQFLKEVK